MDIELPTEDITKVEFEYIKIEKHCFTCFSLMHEEEACPHRDPNAPPPKERNLGITQSIALQRIEADKRRHDERRGYRRPDDSRPPTRYFSDNHTHSERNRGYDRTYHNRREDQPREQSILSRTARSNSNYFRSKAPSFEYRAVERNRPSSHASESFPHHQGGDLRNVIAPPVIDTGNANNALEVTPTRTIKDRLGIATNTRIGTNSGSRERRSALERLSDPIPARRPPSFESGRLQEADSRPVETMQTEQDTVEEQLPEERVPATLRIGSITRSKRGEIPVASQSKATTKRRVTNPTKKRVLRSPILRLSQRTSPVARSATTTRRKLVVEKDKDVPCNKAGTSRQRIFFGSTCWPQWWALSPVER
ncbi:Uncharacterized protein Rs2_11630 [Raphanus sativus]|nr:Uncharacterized protein Rs2_11630 [Raphanus sativus]